MTESLILAIDQGGQSSRVAVYSNHGKLLFCFSADCETTSYRHDDIFDVEFIEQNPEEILKGIHAGLTNIRHALGERCNNIVAGGFAGQGSSLLCWHSLSGVALTPVLSWQDVRGTQLLNNISFAHVDLQSITGLRKSPHYGATKFLWCLKNNLAVREAQQHRNLCMGPIVSYVFSDLLKNHSAVDPGHAQRTLLWNLQTNEWDARLLSLFGLEKSFLPECKFHNSHYGDLYLDEKKIPIMASARDQGASLFARGMPDDKAYYINIGTGAFIQRVSTLLKAPEGILVSPLWLSRNSEDKKLFCWEATVNGAASALNFMRDQTGLAVSPENIQQALVLNPIKECCFLNAVSGLSAPYWRTDLTSNFSPELNPYEKILAWCESIIFQIFVNLELMNSLGRAQKIYISGGLSRSDLLCQKLADLTDLPVHRSDNTDASLQGIAYMASGFAEQWQTVQKDEMFYPRTNHLLKQRFDLWVQKMNTWLSEKDGRHT